MFPEQFKIRMQEMLQDEYDDFEKAFDGERFHALRINPLKEDQALSLERMRTVFGENCSEQKVPWSECGYYYDSKIQPGKHPYHEAGVYYIQEPSAMAPAPAETTTASMAPKVLTNAGTRSAVYFKRPARSPGLTLPKIRAARTATVTTWMTEVTS